MDIFFDRKTSLSNDRSPRQRTPFWSESHVHQPPPPPVGGQRYLDWTLGGMSIWFVVSVIHSPPFTDTLGAMEIHHCLKGLQVCRPWQQCAVCLGAAGDDHNSTCDLT